jgi:hypothetical protein
MPGRWPLIDERPLDFEPSVDDAGLAVLLGERVLEPDIARPGSEESRGVGPDRLARQQPGIEFVDARLGRDVEGTNAAEDVRRRLAVDRDRLGPPAGRNIVEVGDEPLLIRIPEKN